MRSGSRSRHGIAADPAAPASARIAALFRKSPRFQLTAKEDVLLDAQLFSEVEFLMDHRDPRRFGLAHGGKAGGLAIQQDLARGGRLIAREDLHRGRFSGAILADQRMDATGRQRETPCSTSIGPKLRLTPFRARTAVLTARAALSCDERSAA